MGGSTQRPNNWAMEIFQDKGLEARTRATIGVTLAIFDPQRIEDWRSTLDFCIHTMDGNLLSSSNTSGRVFSLLICKIAYAPRCRDLRIYRYKFLYP
jgi:hypothetical protein